MKSSFNILDSTPFLSLIQMMRLTVRKKTDTNPELLWPLFPRSFQEKFIQTFVQGIKNPDIRINNDTWQKILIQLRDEISICPNAVRKFYGLLVNVIMDIPLVNRNVSILGTAWK
jgi:hypothetical protein